MVPRSFWWCCVLVVVAVVLGTVTAKSRNRVQKWQQRTWRFGFGSGPKSDWKFDGAGKGLSRNELDLLADRHVPNGYSNFHYRFDDLRRSHRRKPKHRVKRFVVESDEEPVRFQDDLLENAPFVFGDNYPQDQQGLSNDLVDLDFVRDEDDELGDADIDFMPPVGRNQRLVTVPEVDPFPHSGPKHEVNKKQNATQKVQYTLIIHHGQNPPHPLAELGDASGAAPRTRGQNLGGPLLVALVTQLLLLVVAAASPRLAMV